MSTKTSAVVCAMMAALAGCTLNHSEERPDGMLARVGGNGQLIEPKRCALELTILSRPIRNSAINDSLWSVADEQAIAPEVRRALEVNGLRLGRITGELPGEVEALLKAPPPNKVEPSHVILPDGDNTLVNLAESTPQVSLLLNQGGRASGKDYRDAAGFFRVTCTQVARTEVRLRIVPEIHHGPIHRAFGALPNGGTLQPQQFMQKDGQQEDTLRELAATVDLQPGQSAVVGCLPDRRSSLGAFMFTRAEANSDRLVQKVLLIRASRTELGQASGNAKTKTVPPDLEPIDPIDAASKSAAGPKPKTADDRGRAAGH